MEPGEVKPAREMGRTAARLYWQLVNEGRAMVQTRIKPYLEQVAEQARRVNRPRLPAQPDPRLLIVAAVILAWRSFTQIQVDLPPAGGAMTIAWSSP